MSSLTISRFNQFFSNLRQINKSFGLENLFSKNVTNRPELKTVNSKKAGDVFLVGAGPGDSELLTLKAYRLLQQVDVVMYDWLVNPDILQMIPSHVTKVFVGKKCGEHSMNQADICNLMVQTALTGKNIVRLKGGDPAIFARLAEECDILVKHNVSFCIVPGVTAASGASAYSGIPLTDRDCAQSVRFVTAHLQSKTDEPKWSELVGKNEQSNQTLVFYMGLKRIALIMQRLAEHGMNDLIEVAVIDKASSTEQQICTGNISNIAEKVELACFSGPAVIVVGQVVSKSYLVDLSLLSPNYLTSSNHASYI